MLNEVISLFLFAAGKITNLQLTILKIRLHYDDQRKLLCNCFVMVTSLWLKNSPYRYNQQRGES